MQKIENIFYTESCIASQSLDLYLPDGDTFPVLVYFHGGGLVRGDKAKAVFYEELQEKGVAVISANYRMYPEAAYPDFLKDAAMVVAWAYKHMGQYGNVTGVFVGGSSAGGYITQMLCFDKKYLMLHDIDADAISGYIMDAGQPTTHFNVLKERGIDSRRVIVDEAAPLYHVAAGRAYPPMMIIVSDHDMENRFEQTQLLISTLRHFGCDMERVDYRLMENCSHCQYTRRDDEVFKGVFSQMVCEFIRRYLNLKEEML